MDETTHCRFRNALVKGGFYDDLLSEVCRQIEDHGLELKEAEAAIIDATLIETAARSRNHIAPPPQDRGGPRRATEEMTMFIDDHRGDYGVEGICWVNR